MNAITDRLPNSRKSNFATAPTNVNDARARLAQLLAAAGAPPEAVEEAAHLCDAHTLTLGFARRFATSKRPHLLLHDPARRRRLLTNPHRPVQLLLAGKAHPAGQAGQALIQPWTQCLRQPEIRPHAIVLSDDDMLVTAPLVQGVDVWINTPRRPCEASGTSGRQVLVNGGLLEREVIPAMARPCRPCAR